ncbi:sigma 54-interacting transcriptional regulator [Aneurinibacillus sp. Ricciae_BoGa-3]|uniref:sigma 54-interacting transcriptional regulator n=1 Tax=Aneurinibacillus sp. Ricciae_BoGa-3 TaxID=3022697 RepID=UPI0023416A8C|nr:sigma 54-interacting transcriptional regulator [Aneurinibacillus sp. Ricciae_BoGa-3]WCK55165.1 sigma 54-interacting transcriptional regulator [Aneurinibacillus sp. Ricciae_BoGa-3]
MLFYTEKIMDFLPFGLIVTDALGQITFSNQAAREILGRTPDQMQGAFIHSLFASTAVIKAIKTNTSSVSHDMTDAGTPLVLVEIPFALANGSKAGLILLYQDHILNQLAEESPQFTELKQELEAIMNLVGELVTITDKDGTILRVNASCEKVLGVKERDLVGHPVDVMEKEGVVSTSSTKRVIQEGRKVTVAQTTKSGRRLVVSGYPIYNEDGSMNKVINISRDVTEEDKLAKKLDEMRQMMRHYQSEWVRIGRHGEDRIVVRSKVMEEVYDLAGRVADVDSTVLILGESGVGKEVLARTIHNLSPRKAKPFLKINCGAIPETLMESELFGYAKGTFTGGNKEGKQGIIVSANEGTLFLDEIGEMPLQLQVKLLQVLQEKQITPLGNTAPVDVNVRFIAATNRNLEKMVEEGTFREDLYYRLNVIPITIPGLRDRKEDIPFLVEHFLGLYNDKYNKNKALQKEAMQMLLNYPWPGNVRELQNTVERLVVTIPDDHIHMQDLPDKMLNAVLENPPDREGLTLKEALSQYERNILQQAVNQSRTLKEVSEKLGVDISTISRKVKKYNIVFAELQLK